MSKYKLFDYKKFMIILLIVIFSICFAFITIFELSWYYFAKAETVLYKDTSYGGNTVTVIEKGHSLWKRTHTIIIEINGERSLQCVVPSNYNKRLFPKDNIISEVDDANGYMMVFDTSSGYEARIYYNSDFSKVLYAECCYLTRLDNTLEIIEYRCIDFY